MGRELPVGKPGPLRELFGQFPVGEVADDPRGVVRSQPVVAPGDMAAQLVVVRELAQVVALAIAERFSRVRLSSSGASESPVENHAGVS